MLNRYLARRTGLAADAPDGGLLVMSPVDSTFLTLNEVAAEIWRAADGMTRLDHIVDDRICAAFDIDPALARRDAVEFVDELYRLGLLRVSPEPLNEPVPVTGRLEPAT